MFSQTSEPSAIGRTCCYGTSPFSESVNAMSPARAVLMRNSDSIGQHAIWCVELTPFAFFHSYAEEYCFTVSAGMSMALDRLEQPVDAHALRRHGRMMYIARSDELPASFCPVC